MERRLVQLRALAQTVVERARKEKTLFAKLRENPKAVLEQVNGAPISEQIQVFLYTRPDGHTVLDVQAVDTLASAELTEADLTCVVGGAQLPMNISFN